MTEEKLEERPELCEEEKAERRKTYALWDKNIKEEIALIAKQPNQILDASKLADFINRTLLMPDNYEQLISYKQHEWNVMKCINNACEAHPNYTESRIKDAKL